MQTYKHVFVLVFHCRSVLRSDTVPKNENEYGNSDEVRKTHQKKRQKWLRSFFNKKVRQLKAEINLKKKLDDKNSSIRFANL